LLPPLRSPPPLHSFPTRRSSDLVTPCVSDGGCDRAPDWALGDTDYRAQPPLSNTERRNHFSVLDAREAMYRALTLKARYPDGTRSEEHTSELQSRFDLVCRLLLE